MFDYLGQHLDALFLVLQGFLCSFKKIDFLVN